VATDEPIIRGPIQAAEALAWMRRNGARLRELLLEEGRAEDDGALAGDPAIRAHLRFAASALEATAAEPVRGAIAGLSDDLGDWFEEARPLYEEHVAAGAGAIALEEHLQFGASPGSDPSLDEGLGRAVRIGGWIRLFLLALEGRLGPAADGLGAEVLEAMGTRRRDLSRLILQLDRAAKGAAARRGVADLDTKGRIGEVATVQGHVRLLVEEVAAGLARGATVEGGPP
jgi:hypothetical protein